MHGTRPHPLPGDLVITTRELQRYAQSPSSTIPEHTPGLVIHRTATALVHVDFFDLGTKFVNLRDLAVIEAPDADETVEDALIDLVARLNAEVHRLQGVLTDQMRQTASRLAPVAPQCERIVFERALSPALGRELEAHGFARLDQKNGDGQETWYRLRIATGS